MSAPLSWRRALTVAFGAAMVATVGQAAAPAGLTLAGDGFSYAGTRAKFTVTTRAQAIALATRALGKPTKVGSHGDCGQGDVIGYAKFRGEFELSFVGGRLSGWTEDSAGLATDRGIRVGATLAALRRAYPDIDTDPGDEANGGLGPSFQREDGPNGWLSGVKPSSTIGGMFAGATCLAGV